MSLEDPVCIECGGNDPDGELCFTCDKCEDCCECDCEGEVE